MKLKLKFLKWNAGIPVAMLNSKTAEKIGVRTQDRISLETFSSRPKKLSTILDTVENLVKENEVAVSSEIKKIMNLKKGQFLDVNLAPTPKSLEFIKNKLNGKRLTEKQLEEIIRDIVSNSLSEAEVALFVSVMYRQGMNLDETTSLIEAILDSGNTLNFGKKIVVDKHSIGGIPGNRTTPIVVSICAAAGLIMPKNSSRAITSAAGTADTIETIAQVDFSLSELKKIVSKTNACMVWGGSLNLVPADSKIIAVEKALNLDPEAQMLASIMSKKLAVGSKYILIDIPYGETAKVTKEKALHLKTKFQQLGRYFKRNLKVVLTDGSQPIGNGVGPALELKDVIAVLDPSKKGPKDLEKKSVFLASQIMEMAGKTKKGKGKFLAEAILYSGKAFAKFKEIIEAQKGKVREIPFAKFSKKIISKKSGTVLKIDNKKINQLARVAGCPADKYAGVYLFKKVKDKVRKGEALLEIYAESRPRLREATEFYNNFKPVKLQ